MKTCTDKIRFALRCMTVHCLLIFVVGCPTGQAQQSIFGVVDFDQLIKFDPSTCTNTTVGTLLYNNLPLVTADIAMSIDGRILTVNGSFLYEVDTLNAQVQLIADLGIQFFYTGLAVDPTGQYLYILGANIYEVDLQTYTVTNLGFLPSTAAGDACFRNGEFYYTSIIGLYILDLSNLNQSELISTDVINGFALTSSPFDCGELIYTSGFSGAYSYNIFTEEVKELCIGASFGSTGYASLSEFEPQEDCSYLDLDKDNSTGAENPNRDTILNTCFGNRLPIAPGDIFWYFNREIDRMTIEGVSGFSADEILNCTNAPNLTITGNNSNVLLFDGANDPADYYQALINTLYVNNEATITLDVNVITVTVKPAGQEPLSADISIEITGENPDLFVSIDDITICDIDSITVDASNGQAATYDWSTGEDTPSIILSAPGPYSVTLTDTSGCTASDDFIIDALQTTFVWLAWDSLALCDESIIAINIIVDGPATVDVTLLNQLNNDTYTFNGLTNGDNNILFSSTNDLALLVFDVMSDSECLFSEDSVAFKAELSYSVASTIYDTLCGDELILFDDMVIMEAGTYSKTYVSYDGCDSIVNYTVDAAPVYSEVVNIVSCDSSQVGTELFEYTSINGCDSTILQVTSYVAADSTIIFNTSCNPSDTGSFIQYLSNSLGCDSIVLNTVDLLAYDSTALFSSTCVPADTGIFIDTLMNQFSCDSFIYRTITLSLRDSIYIELGSCSPQDTGLVIEQYTNQEGCDSFVYIQTNLFPTYVNEINQTSCVPADTGIVADTFSNVFGCDSVLIINTTYSLSDTTYIQLTSCNPADTMTIVENYINQQGCDSVVISSTTLTTSDSTFLADASCAAADTGVFIQYLFNVNGCDSIVINQVQLLESDSSFIQDASCNPADTGYFVQQLTNENGCDSTVLRRIILLVSDSTFIENTSCNPADTGNIIQRLFNENGCDSVVYTSTSLLESSTTTINQTSCFPSDTGMSTQVLINNNGCDSVVTTVTSLSLTYTIVFRDSSCRSADTGVYDIIYMDTNGCDSIIRSIISLSPAADTIRLIEKTCDIDEAGIIINQFTNVAGCDSIVINETVFESCLSGVYIPNVFSPNDDGINDTFFPFAEQPLVIQSMQLFNRWGGQVFGINNPSSDFGWNGDINGQPAQEGLYIYSINLVDGRTFVGEVLLIR